jgi:hypothetical protein
LKKGNRMEQYSGLPPQKPVDGAFVAKPIDPNHPDYETMAKEQALERAVEADRRNKTVGCIHTGIVDADGVLHCGDCGGSFDNWR